MEYFREYYNDTFREKNTVNKAEDITSLLLNNIDTFLNMYSNIRGNVTLIAYKNAIKWYIYYRLPQTLSSSPCWNIIGIVREYYSDIVYGTALL